MGVVPCSEACVGRKVASVELVRDSPPLPICWAWAVQALKLAAGGCALHPGAPAPVQGEKFIRLASTFLL